MDAKPRIEPTFNDPSDQESTDQNRSVPSRKNLGHGRDHQNFEPISDQFGPVGPWNPANGSNHAKS